MEDDLRRKLETGGDVTGRRLEEVPISLDKKPAIYKPKVKKVPTKTASIPDLPRVAHGFDSLAAWRRRQCLNSLKRIDRMVRLVSTYRNQVHRGYSQPAEALWEAGLTLTKDIIPLKNRIQKMKKLNDYLRFWIPAGVLLRDSRERNDGSLSFTPCSQHVSADL